MSLLSKTARLLVLAGLAVAVPAMSSAADPPPDRRAAYEAMSRWPDLDEGVWQIDWFARRGPGQPQPALTPAYQAKLDARKREDLQNQNANCVPPGVPEIMTWPYPIEFLYSPGRVTIAIESDSQVRRVYTDGRPHPADPDPAYNGDSIGHWEGDTLVVDTVALNPTTEIAPGVGHSDQAHVIERIHKTGPDSLDIVTTVEDPRVLSKPWTTVSHFVRHREWTIREYVCEQNNHDSVDEQGRPGFRIEGDQTKAPEPSG